MTSADLGPLLPYHDLAHYVTESTLGITRGFFGNIAAGFSIDALSDKQTIRTLGADTWIAEVTARALISLRTGACREEQFADLVNAELTHLGIQPVADLSDEKVEQMRCDLQRLASQFESLVTGDSMTLDFSLSNGEVL